MTVQDGPFRLDRVFEKLATSDKVTLTIERLPEGKMRVTSNRTRFRNHLSGVSDVCDTSAGPRGCPKIGCGRRSMRLQPALPRSDLAKARCRLQSRFLSEAAMAEPQFTADDAKDISYCNVRAVQNNIVQGPREVPNSLPDQGRLQG
jgi:hypothetical protein